MCTDTQVFQTFTTPDTSNAFRSIDAVKEFKLLRKDGPVHHVYLEHQSKVGLLWFKRKFTIAYDVKEDFENLRADFRLGRPGLVKTFQVSTPRLQHRMFVNSSNIGRARHKISQSLDSTMCECGNIHAHML
jgi:hypothetical protein